MLRGILICAGLALASTTAKADNLRLGVDIPVVIPVGDWADASGIGFGGLVKGEFLVMPSLAVTGRIGYIYHLDKDIGGFPFNTAELPILVGAKYYLLGDAEGLYAGAELGLVNLSVSTSLFGVSVSASEMKFGATAGAGYEIAGIDIGARIFLPSLGDAGDFLGVMASVGYAATIF